MVGKRILAPLLTLVLLTGWLAHGSTAMAAAPQVGADGAVLMDAETGGLLYAKNAHKRRAPASTTKVITAILALEMGNLADRVVVSSEAAKVKVGTDADCGRVTSSHWKTCSRPPSSLRQTTPRWL